MPLEDEMDHRVTLPPLERPDWIAEDANPGYVQLVFLLQRTCQIAAYKWEPPLDVLSRADVVAQFVSECDTVAEYAKDMAVTATKNQPQEDRWPLYRGCKELCRKAGEFVEIVVSEGRVPVSKLRQLMNAHKSVLNDLNYLSAMAFQKYDEAAKKAFDEFMGSQLSRKPWVPPKGYLTAADINEQYHVPGPTVQGWRKRDDEPGGPLEGRLVTATDSSHRLYYPEDWVRLRVNNWTPKQHKRQ
jgi:hypothetical protein